MPPSLRQRRRQRRRSARSSPRCPRRRQSSSPGCRPSADARRRRARSGTCASSDRRAARAPRGCRPARRASGCSRAVCRSPDRCPWSSSRSLTYFSAAMNRAVGAVDRIEEAVAREVAHDLARPSVNRRVVEHEHAGLVVVPRVVRRVLEVPLHLAGGHVQRDDGVGVEVVAGTELRVVDRERDCRCRRCRGSVPHRTSRSARSPPPPVFHAL